MFTLRPPQGMDDGAILDVCHSPMTIGSMVPSRPRFVGSDNGLGTNECVSTDAYPADHGSGGMHIRRGAISGWCPAAFASRAITRFSDRIHWPGRPGSVHLPV